MLSNLIDEQTYNDALNLAKQSEVSADVLNLVSEIQNLDSACEVKEPILQVAESEDMTVSNVTTEPTEETLMEMKWLEGALELKNKTMLEKNEYKRFEEINANMTRELNGIYVETETLKKARQDALNSFDIAKVVEIDEKLKKLNGLYSEKLKEADEHKKQIVNYEKEYEEKYKELENSLQNTNFNTDKVTINKEHFGNKVLNDYKSNKTLELVKGFLSNYSKETAKQILQNTPALIESLGGKYADLLKEYE